MFNFVPLACRLGCEYHDIFSVWVSSLEVAVDSCSDRGFEVINMQLTEGRTLLPETGAQRQACTYSPHQLRETNVLKPVSSFPVSTHQDAIIDFYLKPG